MRVNTVFYLYKLIINKLLFVNQIDSDRDCTPAKCHLTHLFPYDYGFMYFQWTILYNYVDVVVIKFADNKLYLFCSN
jgi:hypothetical protein